MNSFTFNHIALSVKDVDQSITFYQKVFNLKEIKNTASSSKTRWLSLGEGKELHLIPRPKDEIKISKTVHFALNTTNIERFVLHLEQLNIKYFNWVDEPNKIYVRNDGVKQVYFKDPNGYWVEVNDAK